MGDFLGDFSMSLGDFFTKTSGHPVSGLYYKTFRIVIYDRNDSTIVEPVL